MNPDSPLSILIKALSLFCLDADDKTSNSQKAWAELADYAITAATDPATSGKSERVCWDIHILADRAEMSYPDNPEELSCELDRLSEKLVGLHDSRTS